MEFRGGYHPLENSSKRIIDSLRYFGYSCREGGWNIFGWEIIVSETEVILIVFTSEIKIVLIKIILHPEIDDFSEENGELLYNSFEHFI